MSVFHGTTVVHRVFRLGRKLDIGITHCGRRFQMIDHRFVEGTTFDEQAGALCHQCRTGGVWGIEERWRQFNRDTIRRLRRARPKK